MAFFQDGPRLGNQFEADLALQSLLTRLLPPEVRDRIWPGLKALGARAAGEMLEHAAEAEANPPRHVAFDPWGRRVDRIEVSRGWQALERIAAEEAIVATAYRRADAEYSRLHQFARLYLYHPSSAIFSCPLAMTDGAARLIELHGDAYLREEVLPRLTATDPAHFWTSGQWMTERSGGSDVSGTATVARREHGEWRLYGDKWFTSATTAQMAMTLARIEEDGRVDERLSLFQVELRDAAGRLRNIRVNRLKDKLGTRALPTAELSLEGLPARPVGERGAGVRTIGTILNITRLYNACCAVAYMRRGLALARDYAARRRAFGRALIDQPLHARTLALLDTEFRAALQLVFHLARLLGREETGVADEAERGLLRLLTPVAKLYTAKQAVAAISETLECFGGAGYVEDTGLPVLLRDAQVLTIWEGTSNVLSLDLLRVLGKTEAMRHLLAELEARLGRLAQSRLDRARGQAAELLAGLARQSRAPVAEAGARRFACGVARGTCAVLLLEQADWCLREAHPDADDACRAAEHWCADAGLPLARG